jgi:hypothetical protein
MNNKFDELAKGLAQSVTRRQALKRFGVGLAGMALACFGLANRAEAHPERDCAACVSDTDCNGKLRCSSGICVPEACVGGGCCCSGKVCGTLLPPCAPNYSTCQGICGLAC